MRVERKGLIYDASTRPKNERIAFFTSLCPLRSGVILSSFQIGTTKHAPDGTIRVYGSRDGGETWSPWCESFETRLPREDFDSRSAGPSPIPGSLAAGEIVETDDGRVLLFATWFDRSEPERPLFDPVTEGILRSRQLLAESTDEGRTWSRWRVVPTPGLTGCAGTGPVVRWDDGTIAFPFESFKEFDEDKPGRHAAWVVVTRDGGRTFSAPLQVAQHPEHKIYYWDQRLCPSGPNGEFIALFWTHHLEQKRDLNVHARQGCIAGDGIHLQSVHETSIRGQIAAPLLLEDGRLLAFVVDRNSPGTMKLWVSRDNGKTWPESDCLLVHTHSEKAALTQGTVDVDFAQYWEDMGKWSFGHPAIRRLADGRVLVAWYAGTPDCMSIHYAHVSV